jgi:hypothetical protein
VGSDASFPPTSHLFKERAGRAGQSYPGSDIGTEFLDDAAETPTEMEEEK